MQRPVFRKLLAVTGACALTATLVAAAGPAAVARRTSPVRFVGTTRDLRAVAAQDKHRQPGGGDAVDTDYIRTHQFEGDEPEGGEAVREGEVAAPTGPGDASVSGGGFGLVASWEGSNHFDSRYSGNGNQFQGEPPDQGLCADDTHVFEIINSVIQVYTPTGTALLDGDPFFPGTEPVGITLAQFFGLPPEFVRPDGPFGPTSFDVSCQFDASTQRWFVSAEYLDQDPKTGDFTGGGGFRLAASTSADPLGSWNIWDVRTTNNGMGGTPDHKCTLGYCYGDYPQLGLDANGVYITTNEFSFFGGEFHGAQLYAFSKADLVAGVSVPGSATFENVFSEAVDFVAYTLQPANTLPADYVSAHGGTMYFGMSQSPLVDGNATAVSLWRLTNTASLDTATPDLSLSETSVETGEYTLGVPALQQDGPTPFLHCANRRPCIGQSDPHQFGPLPLDSGSGKVYGAWLHDGVVYLTTTTALEGPGGAEYFNHGVKWRPIDMHDGVAWVALRPSTTSDHVTRVNQAIVDVPGQNLTYPSVAMNADGEGVIGATLAGPDFDPTAAYIPFTTSGPTSNVEIAGAGVGPNDGFTGTALGDYRSRWGDYGAAAVSPNGTVWFASEYIAQRCTFAEYQADVTCGATRASLANWSTRVSAYNPG